MRELDKIYVKINTTKNMTVKIGIRFTRCLAYINHFKVHKYRVSPSLIQGEFIISTGASSSLVPGESVITTGRVHNRSRGGGAIKY